MIPSLAVIITGGAYYRSCEAFVRKGMDLVLPQVYQEIRWDTCVVPDEEFDLWFLHPMDKHAAIARAGDHFISPKLRKRVAMMDLWAPCFDVCFVSWDRRGPPHAVVGDEPRNHLTPVVVPALSAEWMRAQPRDYVFWHSSDHWEGWDDKTWQLDQILIPALRARGIKRILLAHWDRAGMIPAPEGIALELLPLVWRMSDQYYNALIAGAALFVMSSANRPHSVKFATGLGVPAVLPEGYAQQDGVLMPWSDLSVIDDREGYVTRHLKALEEHGMNACVERVRRILE